MNIFFLDSDPVACAKMHCDKHVLKMIVEYAQLLSTAHRVVDEYKGEAWFDEHGYYKKTHVNHPCAVWTRESSRHYEWLHHLLVMLVREYEHRYGKDHKTLTLALRLTDNPDRLKDRGWRDPPQCMPIEFKDVDAVAAYRQFYIGAKSKFAAWKTGRKPSWWPSF